MDLYRALILFGVGVAIGVIIKWAFSPNPYQKACKQVDDLPDEMFGEESATIEDVPIKNMTQDEFNLWCVAEIIKIHKERSKYEKIK